MRKAKAKKAAKAKELSEKTLIETRAKAYRDMEPHVCDLARAAQLAMLASDDEGLFLFAVEQFDTMAQRFRERYYAESFSLQN
jgi:hypothetical protein